MKFLERFSSAALLAALALSVHSISFAQTPFDGTWRTNMGQTKFSPKPIAAFVSEGWYHCTSCSPQIVVKADGTDQPVTGQGYDTLNVKELDAKSIQFVTKKGGQVISEQTRTVSADGKTLTVKSTMHPLNGGPDMTSEATATRVGLAPANINGTSGSWKVAKVKLSDNGVLTTYKTNGDELTMTEPTGESYTAKFDGKDYPVKGAYSYDAVSLKRVDKNTIEETDKRNGTVVDVAKMTVSSDGKKMTVVDTNPQTDRTSTYYAVKQ